MKVLVVDIGGTFIKYACMTEKMEILTRGKIETPKERREDLIEAIGTLYDTISSDIVSAPGEAHRELQIHDNMPALDGIAISMPGIIDSERGYCAMGGALRYNDNFYLRRNLYERCPVKIYMENDAKCAAVAEATVGSLKDVADGFVLIFGTMIGGGYIKDHKLHRGKHFSAGEVSYMISDRDKDPGYDTVWGNRCGTPRRCKMFAERKGLNAEQVDGVSVFAAVEKGDADAIECLQKFTKEIAVQLFNLQTVLDLERFAIGGGISAQPVFIEYIKKHLKAMYAACPFEVPQAEVVCCKFQNDANLVGALQGFLSA